METRSTDASGRVSLPETFANTTVIIEQVSDTEIRIRRASVVPKGEVLFREETSIPLSDADRDRFLELLENPPAPNARLKRAMESHAQRHG